MRFFIAFWGSLVLAELFSVMSKVPNIDAAYMERWSWIWMAIAIGNLAADYILGGKK